MKILLDENIPGDVKKQLKKDKYDVEHVNDHLKGKTDQEIFEYAIKTKRCIITKDIDFHKFKKLHHYGIIKIVGCMNEPYVFILKIIKDYEGNMIDKLIYLKTEEYIEETKKYTKKGKFSRFHKVMKEYH